MIPELLVGTADGLWAVGDEPARAVLEGEEVTALATGEEGAWAVVGGRLWAERDGAWREAASPVPAPRSLLPLPDGLLVGTDQARLLRWEGGSLRPVPGFEAAPGRDRWYTPWGGPPATRSMARGPEGTLYVNVHVGGVLRSRDGGQSWQPTMDIDADAHQVAAHPEQPGLVAAACARGLALTRDGAESWTLLHGGLHARYMRAVTFCDGWLIGSASTGPSTERAAAYRLRHAEGGDLERCRDGLPEWFAGNVDTGCLAARGTLAALGAPDGRVFLSHDAGETWEERASLAAVRCLVFR